MNLSNVLYKNNFVQSLHDPAATDSMYALKAPYVKWSGHHLDNKQGAVGVSLDWPGTAARFRVSSNAFLVSVYLFYNTPFGTRFAVYQNDKSLVIFYLVMFLKQSLLFLDLQKNSSACTKFFFRQHLMSFGVGK